MKEKKILLLILISLLFPLTLSAAGWQDLRQISVSGDSEVYVVPDQIVITFGISTQSQDVIDAKKLNDVKIKKVLAMAAKYKIAPKDIQTDAVSLTPKYDYQKESKISGYTATNDIVVMLHDVVSYEDFINDAVQLGANYVTSVEFKTSELRKYRDKARLLAISAAKEKAVAMAAVLGQTVGVPLSIEENSYPGPVFRSFSLMNSNAQSPASTGGQTENQTGDESTTALGRIKITASVHVIFELK